MSACSCLRLILLVFVNLLFLVIGISVIGLAIWLLGWPHSLQQEMATIAPKLIQMAFRESAATNMGSLILTVGAVTFIITVIGLHGTIMKRSQSLTVYAVILILIALLQACVGIGSFMFYLGGSGKHRLITGLQNNYRPKDKANVFTIIYDTLFVSLECCAIDNFTDFDSGNLESSSSEIPWSCCEMINKWELIMKDPMCPETSLSNTNSMKHYSEEETFGDMLPEMIVIIQDGGRLAEVLKWRRTAEIMCTLKMAGIDEFRLLLGVH